MPKTDDNDVNELRGSLKMLEIHQKAEHNETVPINRLPVELFCMLLEYLDRSQLFEYESVCKKWTYFVAAFVRQKLVISRENKVRPRHWFYLDERCLPTAVMVRADLNVEPVENSFWFDLRQLKICNSSAKHCSFKAQKPLLNDLLLINRLTSLEVLEVSQLPDGTISLPKLRYLAIHNTYSNYKPIFIDCPKLLSFKTKMTFYGSLNFEFSHPKSITHLYLDLYADQDTLPKFTSLRYLSMRGFDHDYGTKEDYARSIFINFPKLKKISLRPGRLGAGNPHFRLFIGLLEEKQALGREDVALLFCGVTIESGIEFDCLYPVPYNKHHRLLPKFYLENYSRLRMMELRWIQVIHYAELDFPEDFHEKFRYVREIRVNSQVADEDRLIEFIGEFKRLESLGIKKVAQLGATFYKKLASCSSIPYLAIWMESQIGLRHFDFLLDFEHLVCFTILKEDIRDQIVWILFDHFEIFEINYYVEEKEDNIKIRRPRIDADFEFSVCPGHLETFDHLHRLLNLIESECRTSEFDDSHSCDCSCEFQNCPNDSYKINYEKQFGY